MTLHTYLPQDRLKTIANNSTLPDRASGSVLFADISGFTALTESLRDTLGARRGTEELSKRLGEVYSALIEEIEKRNGSVIGFAGDAMMCWFEEKDEGGMFENEAALPAVLSAFKMQEAIKGFPELGLKVVVASGRVRRLVVGDPAVQRLDVLAGAIVARTAHGEHLANGGDVLTDEATAHDLGSVVVIKEWRNGDGGERFAVVQLRPDAFRREIQPAKSQPLPPNLDPQLLRPFIHKTVYELETSGRGTFLTEFRPCVALFVKFTGINYEVDTAEAELDDFVREVQTIAGIYDGTLLQITIGDKGSYLYINFGALSAHEDDAKRAVKTALALRNRTELKLQMGITKGLMRVGAYGGTTRHEYGALGDEVNLAAQLMTLANEDELLLSSHVYKAVMDQFTFEPRPPLSMKGKAEPLPVFAVTGEIRKRAVRLQEPNYSLPMVGREQELEVINDKLDLVVKGKGQIIGIVAEAGIGKSRLVAEVIRNARRKGFVGFGGACQSDGIHTPYLVWKSIWQAFFSVDPDVPLKRQIKLIEDDIAERAPSRLNAVPLLNMVLDLNIPENDFTKNLEPKIRQSALHASLEDCLRAQAKEAPTLIVIEDLHWIDAVSQSLLDELAKALADYAVCFVLAYRPPQMERLQVPRFEALPQFTRFELRELSTTEAETAIRAKLAQLYPARGGALPDGLVDALMSRAQGNPFYLEELLNYVRDRGLDLTDLDRIELPDSLHTLILSRIDQLSEQEKTTLRVASIIGRLFRAKWLTGYYPELGPFPKVKAVLDELARLEITPIESEHELIYLFKHIIVLEVTYESLPFATRAKLHEQLALYLESIAGAIHNVNDGYDSPLLDTITYHFLRSENQGKQREYLLKAGEIAQKNFANDTALEYFGTLLTLLKDENAYEQSQIHLKRGEVFELTGKYDDAEREYHAALDTARDNMRSKANAQFALGKLHRLRGEFALALDWLAQAQEVCNTLHDMAGLAVIFIEKGMVLHRKSDYELARDPLIEGLALARQMDDKLVTALALNNLGNVAYRQTDYAVAQKFYEESLSLRREAGDKMGIAASLNNLGLVAFDQGDYSSARALHEESLALRREMGDKQGTASSLNNLGIVVLTQGEYVTTRTLQEESLTLRREMGDKYGISVTLINLGFVALAQGDYRTARMLCEEAQVLCQDMGDKTNMSYALLGLGLVEMEENSSRAKDHILQSLRLRVELAEQLPQTSSLIGMAQLKLKDGDAKFAAQLLGAVDVALKGFNGVVESELIYFQKKTMKEARDVLGDAVFQSEWEAGSKLALDEVVTKVLEDGCER